MLEGFFRTVVRFFSRVPHPYLLGVARRPDFVLKTGVTRIVDRRLEGACAVPENAEAGRYSEAVSTADKALRLPIKAGGTHSAQINQELLQLYRAGKRWHEAPAQVQSARL